MNARPLFLLAMTVAVTTTGCATPSGSSGRADRNRISGEELATTNSSTVYEALELLRPSWMNSRGPISMTNSSEATANVYMHGMQVGTLDYLRQVLIINVEELRYYPPGEAGARFGMGNPRGVIEVILKT